MPGHLVRAWERHHDELSLDVAPAVEDREDSEEEEDVSPLHEEVVGVEGAEEERGDQAQHKEVECEPGQEEDSPPVAEAVTTKAVAQG